MANPRSYEDEGGHSARFAKLDEIVPVDGPGTLFLDLDQGSVRVTTHADPTVEIRARARGLGAEDVDFAVHLHEGDVEVDATRSSWLPRWLRLTRIHVEARVPEGFSVEIDTGGGRVSASGIGGRIAVRSGGGSIRVREVSGPALLQTSAGAIRIARIEGDVRAKTGAGGVEAERISGFAELRSGAGPLRIARAVGPIDLRTGAGPVRVDFSRHPEGQIETQAGSVTIGLPRESAVDIDAKTRRGEVEVRLPIECEERATDELRGRLGGGGAPLRIRTGAGSIRITGRERARRRDPRRRRHRRSCA